MVDLALGNITVWQIYSFINDSGISYWAPEANGKKRSNYTDFSEKMPDFFLVFTNLSAGFLLPKCSEIEKNIK